MTTKKRHFVPVNFLSLLIYPLGALDFVLKKFSDRTKNSNKNRKKTYKTHLLINLHEQPKSTMLHGKCKFSFYYLKCHRPVALR